jgi:hypothetical protein
MLNYNYNIIDPFSQKKKGPAPPFLGLYANVMLVGGGGAGSVDGGAGGGGGQVYTSSISFGPNLSYQINIGTSSANYYTWNAISTGSGFAVDPPYSNRSGSYTEIINLSNTQRIASASGGGNGGYAPSRDPLQGVGSYGGSGGGGYNGRQGGSAVSDNSSKYFGHNGGDGSATTPGLAGGGGGGAAVAGGNPYPSASGYIGGIGGYGVPILGFYSASIYVGAGGNGAGVASSGSYNQTGSLGGGGAAGYWTSNTDKLAPQNGVKNTGGGGGGLWGSVTNPYTASFGGSIGGDGVAVVFYKGTPQAIGGVTETRYINGEYYTQHTFTSSGVLQISRWI